MAEAFKLKDSVSANNDADMGDTKKFKRTLMRLDFLKEPDHGVTGFVDTQLLEGIRSFQQEKGLTPDGVVKPGGASERLIAAALAERQGAAPDTAFALSDSVGEKAANRPQDLRNLKRALAATGHFPEDKAQDPTGRLDDDLELGIRSFQRDFNLKRDSVLRPGGETERTLNRVVKPEVLTQAQMPAGAAAQQPGSGTISWPAKKQVIKEPFGPRKQPLPGASKMHEAVDFKAPLGTAIHSTQDGKVHTIGNEPAGSGKFILIQNDDGSMSGFAHTGAISTLRQGQRVRSGQQIGVSDGSGNITGPHLHYTYRPGTPARLASRGSPKVDPMTTQFKGMKPTP